MTPVLQNIKFTHNKLEFGTFLKFILNTKRSNFIDINATFQYTYSLGITSHILPHTLYFFSSESATVEGWSKSDLHVKIRGKNYFLVQQY